MPQPPSSPPIWWTSRLRLNWNWRGAGCASEDGQGSGVIHLRHGHDARLFSCDAGVDAGVWQGMVQRAVQRSFNAITVDGDTSTNDTVLAFAAGPPLAQQHHAVLEQGLTQAMQQLAQAIARDGEGATCLIQVRWRVRLTRPRRCRWRARSVVRPEDRSPWPGSNWGRIVAAAVALVCPLAGCGCSLDWAPSTDGGWSTGL